jgi:hypothetical protein
MAPDVSSDGVALKFELTVTDEHNANSTDSCITNVTWNNQPPVAEAGESQNVASGDVVTLDGTQSSDPDDGIDSYTWRQTSGQAVSLSDSNSSTPWFDAPENSTTVSFELEVSDFQGLKDTDTCSVQVTAPQKESHAPVADAGEDQIVTEGTTVELSGLGSKDEDNDLDAYSWSQVSGPQVTLSDPNSYGPYFVTPSVDETGAELEFKLTVTDQEGAFSEDFLIVTVHDNGVDLGNEVPAEALPLPRYEETINAGVLASQQSSLIKIELVDPAQLESTLTHPSGQSYPLFSFELMVQNPGDPAQVTFFFDKPLPKGYIWYKYADNSWHPFESCSFSKNKKQVTLNLVDGGIGDSDDMVNGVIVDPSGPGPDESSSSTSPTATSGSSSGGGGGGGCTLSPESGFGLEWLLILSIPLLLHLQFQRKP